MDDFLGEKCPLSVSFVDFFFCVDQITYSQVGTSRILLACPYFKESKWEKEIGDLTSQ